MRRMLFKSLVHGPLTEAAPAADDAALAELAAASRTRRAAAPGPHALHPRSGRGLLQRLRARDPCAQQRRLRSRALRPALRRLAAARRCAARDGPGHDEHARSARAHLPGDTGSQMGRRRRRLRARRRRFLPAATPASAAFLPLLPVDLHIPRLPALADHAASRPACIARNRARQSGERLGAGIANLRSVGFPSRCRRNPNASPSAWPPTGIACSG